MVIWIIVAISVIMIMMVLGNNRPKVKRDAVIKPAKKVERTRYEQYSDYAKLERDDARRTLRNQKLELELEWMRDVVEIEKRKLEDLNKMYRSPNQFTRYSRLLLIPTVVRFIHSYDRLDSEYQELLEQKCDLESELRNIEDIIHRYDFFYGVP